jgi:Rps23 Pro-64 3,4-dihydroxylase Tpa1-like proline 4-hydroxylase
MRGALLNQAVIRRRDGELRVITMPADGSAAMRLLLTALRDPGAVNGQLLRLGTPDGGSLELPAAEVASLELAPHYFVVHDFLTADEAEQTSAHILKHGAQFEDATISLYTNQHASSPVDNLRRARVLNAVADIMHMFVPKLNALAPRLVTDLRMPQLPLRKLECQITAHGDGDFFNTHIDNGLPDIAHRRISYVYYIHAEPKRFTGGILRFYNTLLEGATNACGKHAADYDPMRNSLIVFPSHCHHEVTPIACASSALADQRLTVNGWLCV